ncbi:MAG: hypothetical protein KA159_01510 [Halioglobus sp.]|nr:hypothetical protein [Halioglobus sp.]MBP6724301.1 hypothetical protein [Halioglobus sp.]
MTTTKLVLFHGLFACNEAGKSGEVRSSVEQRVQMFARYGNALGVRDYEWVEGRRRALMIRLMRLAGGTAHAVDAVEIIELDEASFRASLFDERARIRWQEVASCAPYASTVSCARQGVDCRLKVSR